MHIDKNNLYENNSPNKSLSMEGAQTRKLIQKIENAPILKKINITFDDLERMYNEIGYEVFRKRGSHAVVHLTETENLVIVIPHANKYVNVNDIRRFLLVKNGKLEEALAIRNHQP